MGCLTIPCREEALINLASTLQASSWIKKRRREQSFTILSLFISCIYFCSRIYSCIDLCIEVFSLCINEN
jgi:hypothetical protein